MYGELTAERAVEGRPANQAAPAQRPRRWLSWARTPFAGRRDAGRAEEGANVRRLPEDLLPGELVQNATTWAALRRLGVRDGTELPLTFFFETAGAEADHELAEFLRGEWVDTAARTHARRPRRLGQADAVRGLRARRLRLRRVGRDRPLRQPAGRRGDRRQGGGRSGSASAHPLTLSLCPASTPRPSRSGHVDRSRCHAARRSESDRRHEGRERGNVANVTLLVSRPEWTFGLNTHSLRPDDRDSDPEDKPARESKEKRT
jgi:hypothetical protein